jgi:DNA-binding MarR family transcriptional regulator
MTRIAASLEAAGLVTRTDHPSDGRQVLLAASPDGAALVREDRGAATPGSPSGCRTCRPRTVEVLRRAAVVLERLAAS